MKAFWNLLRWDMVMQVRYGFWAAGAVVTMVWVALLWSLPKDLLDLWLPYLLYSDISVVGLFFICGIVFFDRRQGMINALAVSPMTTRSWLVSKVVSLTFLSTMVVCALAVLLYGWGLAWGRLLPGIILSSVLFTLIGFLGAARLTTMTGFLTFFILVSIPSGLPTLAYFDIWSHPLLWLLPFQPMLVVIRHGFVPVSTGEATLAFVLLLAWIGLGYHLAVLSFHRYLASRPGYQRPEAG